MNRGEPQSLLIWNKWMYECKINVCIYYPGFAFIYRTLQEIPYEAEHQTKDKYFNILRIKTTSVTLKG